MSKNTNIYILISSDNIAVRDMNHASELYLFDPAPVEALLGEKAEALKTAMEAQQKEMEQKKKEGEILSNVIKVSQGSLGLTNSLRDPKYNNTPHGLDALYDNYDSLKDALEKVRSYGGKYKGVADQVELRLKKADKILSLGMLYVRELYGAENIRTQIDKESETRKRRWGLL